jgi:hypothetical protein
MDELLDWMTLNGRLLSLQRLRNLLPRFAVDRALAEAVVAWVAESAPSLRWRKIEPHSLSIGEAQPVFGSDVVSFMAQVDPTFERYGYMRPTAARSDKSREPDLNALVSFGFQLRLLFGPGSRSEVVRVLLTDADGPLDAARIAEDAGYAKRNVSDTLSSLVESRVVKGRWSKNERVFSAYRDKWATLLERGPTASNLPTFMAWVQLLPALEGVYLWFQSEDLDLASDYILGSRARDLVERIAPLLENLGLAPLEEHGTHGPEFVLHFEELVRALLRLIRYA